MRSRGRLVFALLIVLAACGDDVGDDAAADGGKRMPDTDAGDARDPKQVASCEKCTLDDKVPAIGDDCGLLESDEIDEDVVACVQKHLASGKPFRVREQRMGIDSAVVYAWTQDAAGVVKQYDFDSNVCGFASVCRTAGCGPRVNVWTCQGATLVAEMDDGDVDSGVGFSWRAPLIECASVDEEKTLCEPTD
jgi:hypothetical protein